MKLESLGNELLTVTLNMELLSERSIVEHDSEICEKPSTTGRGTGLDDADLSCLTYHLYHVNVGCLRTHFFRRGS